MNLFHKRKVRRPEKVGLNLTDAYVALSKVTEKDLQNLATVSDVSEFALLYETFFSDLTSEENDLPDTKPKLTVSFASPVSGADPGLEVEAGMSQDQMLHNLGFVHGLPVPFNTKRHRDGKAFNSWDHPTDADDAALVPLKLHDHQIQGVHATMRNLFSSDPQSNLQAGVLYADQVGYGKCLQSIATASFLIDVCTRQEKHLPLPPLVGEYYLPLYAAYGSDRLVERRPFVGESNTLPPLPTLVIVPGTLIEQWHLELKTGLRPKSVDVLLYGTGLKQHQYFFSESGPYETSNQPPQRRIILASHSVSRFTGVLLCSLMLKLRD